MSLQIPVQKDIGEYEEKIVGKLSFRTLLCVTGGFGSAIAAAAMWHFWVGIEVADAAFPVMCASIPFWLVGFWRPFGMRAEKFIPLLAAHHIKDQRLLYSSPAAPDLKRIKAGRPSRKARRAARRKGAEGNEPSRQENEEGKRKIREKAS
ncbi:MULTISPECIES: PrgI family protein [unclassified Adlercreutzia]|uniref:PrgI family protein n=1 Tax=unclassified Adlercreutzia TaxID=2636013 RepID=UPI0013EC91C6|nr:MULTISPECIES: PrgI family protein [unclassified Adlercreutzia]